jgi:superfamily II DNA or RNA helicase/ubiquinone/menaquinone biosynthesis C-methylase UbiE
MDFGFRYYQKEADKAIYDELFINNKCIVKMFCGTGKSRLMRYCRIAQNKKLVVYVVPSLSLLEQFYTDYLRDFSLVKRISCEQESTTDSTEIIEFLKMPADKIICITYQSFETLVHLLGDTKIDVCIFDEAHHVVGKTYQTLIFDSNVCEKQIFFTATPKNANGVIMYDKDNLDAGMCGKFVYDYSYFKGVLEGYLNPFEIRIDFYTENTNASVYEAMARAILASRNSRVLTFHADVNGDSDTSVLRFVNKELFIVAFNKVLNTEFPEKIGYYKKIQMIGLIAEINMKIRKQILENFDATPDDEIMVISSCQTIGEGIDTKSANMCVFVDPKSSIVGITQNIGRIVRRIFGEDKPNSTILIPCWVDKEKYLGCDGDKDKCDEVIREDMNKEGNFNGILNVMSALKQEHEDLFDACLNYPSTYSLQEIEGNLLAHGYQLEEPVSLVESLEHMLDTDIELDSDETYEELLARTAEENNVVIEVHSNSLETPVEYYGQGDGKEVIRIFKTTDEETEETIYQPIVKKDGKKRNTDDTIEPLRRENRFNVKVHTNPDVKVLWNLKEGFDLSKDICSCIIDCEVVDMWPQRFEELKAFIDTNKRRPPQNTKNKEVILLSGWLANNLTKYKNKTGGMKDIEKYNLWTQFLEKYKEYFITDDELWMQSLDKIKEFISENKKRPSIKSQNAEEVQCARWFSNQQQYYKNETTQIKNDTRYNLWVQFLEEYKEYFATVEEIWYNQFEKLKTFIDINKKCPSNSAKKIEEKRIAQWLSDQKKYYKCVKRCYKNESIRITWSQFLEEYKEYFMTIDEIWNNRFENLKTIIDINKKLPSAKSKNIDEKFIGGWLDSQKHNYKTKSNSMNSEERCAIWEQFLEEYKEYFVSIDENWGNRFENLKTFIDINNKIPSQIGKTDEEQLLGHWYSNQQQNYKNNKSSMNTEPRRKIWRQFLEEYKEYFNTIKEEKSSSIIEDDDEEIIIKPKQKKSAKLPKPKAKEDKVETKEDKVETKEDIRVRTKPLITQFHNKFCKMRSDNLAQHFQQNPSDFAEYHRIRDENMSTFDQHDIPCERIIQELEKIKKGGKHIVDMGCGTAKIAEHFKDDSRFHITSYDHVAINDTVQVCDISHMPLEDGSVDICIMSLALWGSNYDEYIREALRVLDENGILYIIDSTKRWSEESTQDAGKLKLLLETNGFQIKSKDTKIDKWCYFKCMK